MGNYVQPQLSIFVALYYNPSIIIVFKLVKSVTCYFPLHLLPFMYVACFSFGEVFFFQNFSSLFLIVKSVFLVLVLHKPSSFVTSCLNSSQLIISFILILNIQQTDWQLDLFQMMVKLSNSTHVFWWMSFFYCPVKDLCFLTPRSRLMVFHKYFCQGGSKCILFAFHICMCK